MLYSTLPFSMSPAACAKDPTHKLIRTNKLERMSVRMPRDVGDNHVENWVRQLDTERMTYAKSHRDRLEPEFAQLRETLDQSSRRLKAVLDQRRWQPLIFGVLQDSTNHALDLERLLQDELSQTCIQSASIASPTILRRIANAAEMALKTLESHLAMADHFTKYAGDLHVEFTRLLHRRSLDPARLQTAILTGDVAALSSAPGVGNRTASRIILDLKGKVDASDFPENGFAGDTDGQVIAALTALGYSPAEARAAAGTPAVAAETEVDDRIRVALQQFATRS